MCDHAMSVLSLNLVDMEYISKAFHFQVMIDIDAAFIDSSNRFGCQGLELAGNSLSIGTFVED